MYTYNTLRSVKSKVVCSVLSVPNKDWWPCTCKTASHLGDSVIYLHWHSAGSAVCLYVCACICLCCFFVFFSPVRETVAHTQLMLVISTASISILSMLCCVCVCVRAWTHRQPIICLQTSNNEYKCAPHFTQLSCLVHAHTHTLGSTSHCSVLP